MPSRTEDQQAIRDVLHRYCYGTDMGDVEAWVEGFTEDCKWDGGPFGVCEGKNAMRTYFKQGGGASKSLRHLLVNSIIDVQDERAQALSYVLVVGTEATPAAIFFTGFYSDELVRAGGRWLIRKRTIRTDTTGLELPLPRRRSVVG